jgi:hypothetical protein
MMPIDLITVVKIAKSSSDLINSAGLKDAISTIVGDIHVDAAKLALNTAREPRDRLNSVITHLETAHIAYSKIHGQWEDEKWLGWKPVVSACHKDVLVCCVMAICYSSLGERQAVIDFLSRAETAFAHKEAILKSDFEIRFPLFPLGFYAVAGLIANVGYLNPRNWAKLREPMNRQDFTRFKATLEQTMV